MQQKVSSALTELVTTRALPIVLFFNNLLKGATRFKITLYKWDYKKVEHKILDESKNNGVILRSIFPVSYLIHFI